MALQLGSFLGSVGEGVEIQGLLGAEVPLAKQVAVVAWAGLQRHPSGEIEPRDAVLGVSWVVRATPTFVWRVQPGLNLPTGGIGSGLYFTPLSTASVDPYLTTDVVAGGTWLVGGSLVARAPLYDGWDRRRQGVFLRADLRLARRVSLFVPWVGVSAVDQLPSAPVGAVPAFRELAATAGSVANLSSRWSLTGQLRVPFARSSEAEFQFAGGVSARVVVGARKQDEHENPAVGRSSTTD